MSNSSTLTEPINDSATPLTKTNSYVHVAFASFIGTAVEFYDFYIFGLATAMFIGPLFFPSTDPQAQTLLAFLTFGIAFIARPVGSALFGHFGDKLGRKTTLVASLLVMGISTTLIGFIPSYHSIGFIAPLSLCILRFGQGLGLGGEWGGAALLATENAPKGKRALFGMFPQLGPPVGFIIACGIFIVLEKVLTPEQFMNFGWRIPFISSAVLVMVGLYVRLSIVESPAFAKLQKDKAHAHIPFLEMCKHHAKALALGSFCMMACYVLFFLITVFSLQYGTQTIGFSRIDYLFMLSIAIVFMAIASPISAYLSDRYGRRPILLISYLFIFISGILFAPALNSGNAFITVCYLSFSLFAMGFNFSPMGAFLPEIFPTKIRYTGASMTYNLGGILGGSLTPFFAAKLIGLGGIGYVGMYLSIAAIISFIAIWLLPETKHNDFME